ncbi:MAG: class I SAM-dependent methyltransferase [Clostridia bacterium]|nr:class I SAM-dependent methyltransferase [Clostridia bacterium]
MLPYQVLANFYDNIIKDDSYDKWTNYIVQLVKKYTTKNTGLDVACGSGIVTLKLKKAGFNVTGIDISNEMLLKAQSSALKEGLNVPFLRQDMKSLRTFEKVGFITVINDGLNYVKQADIKKAFNSFNKSLLKGGTLIFDVSSTYKLKTVLGNNMYGDDNENLSYIWFNTLNENSVDIAVTLFEKEGDSYRRYEETQTQYIHNQLDIENALSSAGFEIVSVTDANGNAVTDTTERILFITKKL